MYLEFDHHFSTPRTYFVGRTIAGVWLSPTCTKYLAYVLPLISELFIRVCVCACVRVCVCVCVCVY